MEYSASFRRGPNLRYLRKQAIQQQTILLEQSDDDSVSEESDEYIVHASRRYDDLDLGSSSAPPRHSHSGPPPSGPPSGPPPSGRLPPRPPPSGPPPSGRLPPRPPPSGPPPSGPPLPRPPPPAGRPPASFIRPNRRRTRPTEGPPPAQRRAAVPATELPNVVPEAPLASSTNANRNPDLHALAQGGRDAKSPVVRDNLVLCVYRNSKKSFDTCEVKLTPYSSKTLRDRHLFRRMRKHYEYNLRGWIRGLFSFKSITTVRLLQVNNN
jgi:hypothetical protein